MLEIRLEELADVVDYHVIVESNMTFTGHAKALSMQRMPALYAKHQKRIIYIPLGSLPGTTNWDRENFQRDALLQGLFRPDSMVKDGDIVFLSDLDEIPKPSLINDLRTCMGPEEFHLSCPYNYFRFGLVKLRPWTSAAGFVYSTPFRQGSLSAVRNRKPDEVPLLSESCWHCSWCFRRISDFIDKMRSFSHSELNKPQFATGSHVKEKVCKGLDLFNRISLKYTYYVLPRSRVDMPSYVRNNSDRFSYMIDRKPPKCGFVDTG